MTGRDPGFLQRLFGGIGRKYSEIAILSRQTVSIGRRVDELRQSLDEMRREQQLLLGAISLPPAAAWRGLPAPTAGAPAQNAYPCSTLCRQESFDQPHFPYWTARLGQALIYHRKLWEFVFICQALWERGVLVPGARGLGFGVGAEPLTAFFAAQDCTVVGTDMAEQAATQAGWTDTAQHATGLEALRMPWICPDTLFGKNVTFRTCDMNAIPADLKDFDFCWSACALEHLGSIHNGLAFIEASVGCLKPGGWAVHTTEFNIQSNEDTVDNLGTVLFRRRDFEALAARLTAKGCRVAPFDFNAGDGIIDRYIDVPPYRNEPHLKLALQGYASTSFGIIVQKGAAA